nr:15071_t:CDS:1 [Entrophospora candida]
MVFIESLVEGKISVKALIDTSLKFNTISKSLFNRLGTDHGIRPTCDLVENLYKDAIGEINCLDLQFQYKGTYHSLDNTDVINFEIRKNPTFDLVLGQGWLWAHEVKMRFNPNAKIVIDGMSIPLIDEDFNKASSSKNSSLESDLSIEEITNMIKILSLRSEDNKQQKRHHDNIPLVSPAHRRVSKIKKYPMIDLGDGCGKLSIKTHLNNIWKSVHSIENDIEHGVFEKLRIIEYELSCINKAKLPWVKSDSSDTSNSSNSPTSRSKPGLTQEEITNMIKKYFVIYPLRHPED